MSEHAEQSPANRLTAERARGCLRDIYEGLSRSFAIRYAAGLLNSGCEIVACDRTSITLGFRHRFLSEKAGPGAVANHAIAAEVERLFGRAYQINSVHILEDKNR